jgi:hypothetical protein
LGLFLYREITAKLNLHGLAFLHFGGRHTDRF